MTSLQQALLLASILVPAILAAACIHPVWRARLSGLFVFAPLPAFLTAVATLLALGRGGAAAAIVLDPSRLELTLTLDQPRALLLAVVALLWMLAGWYARGYMRQDPQLGRFAVAWLLSLTGCLGVFIAGDLVSYYLLFALASLPAYGLVVHDGTAAARRAARIYIALAVLGEACMIVAFVLLASSTEGDSLLITKVVESLPNAPLRNQILVFLLLGFGLKAGLVPLHGWLPLAHPAAPMPASAVLSGAIIKTGIIGMIAFLPFGSTLTGWGVAITALGFVTAFYGVLVGLTQQNAKTVLAYSSVSQMGVVTAILGAGLASGSTAAPLMAAFYAAHHALVKGGLFLAVGVVGASASNRRWAVLVPATILALSLGGLPLTSGALAKSASKPFFASDLLSILSVLSAVGSTVLMLHFMRRLAAIAQPARHEASPALTVPWLATATASVAVPWILYGTTLSGDLREAVTPGILWSGLWPVLIGAALAAALRVVDPKLPAIPEGDVICTGERAARACFAQGRLLDPVDRALRHWPVAGAALLALLVVLGGALWLGTTGAA